VNLQKNCSSLHTKPTLIDRHHKYKLWPNLMSSYDLEHGETLIGFEEAMDIVWQNQNPPDCSKAKYLIAEPFLQGVGSELHVHGVALAIAIATKRVFLQHGGWSWRFRNPHCAAQNKQSLECYYVPVSKCSLEDALATMKTINPEYTQPFPPPHSNSNANTNSSSNFTDQVQQGVEGGGNSVSRKLPVVRRPVHKAGQAPVQGHGSPFSVSGNSRTGHQNQHHHVTWTSMEDADLEAAVIKYGVQGRWQKIAAAMEKYGKRDVDCLLRFRREIRKRLNMRATPAANGVKRNFNDKDSMTDLLVENYGVVIMNKIMEVKVDEKTNAVSLSTTENDDKFSDNVLVLAFKVMLDNRKFVPNDFKYILDCAEVGQRGYGFWWWRAISATYLLRPNQPTLKLLQEHEDPVLKELNGMCVSAYVRHGDKGIEMSLIPFAKYAHTAECMWQKESENNPGSRGHCAAPLISANNNAIVTQSAIKLTNPESSASGHRALQANVNRAASQPRQLPINKRQPPNKKNLPTPPSTDNVIMPASFNSIQQPLLRGFEPSLHPRVFYLGSEDPNVFKQADAWAKSGNITLRYSKISQVLLSDRKGTMKHRDMENSMPSNRQMEYFSYLLHLQDLIRCRSFICTLASNYCRLVDELRATVGGKANAFYADLSLESCAAPPCIRPFSMAEYRGPIYDPTFDNLWR